MISKIETGDRPPAEDFPPRLDAVPELDTRGALSRLWDQLKKGQRQRLYGWFQEWVGIGARATVLRWYEPLVVPGLLQTEEYARAILSARPGGNLDDLDEQVAARLARQAVLDRTGAPQLWCILDEGVLHRAIGGSKVMRSQLYHLDEHEPEFPELDGPVFLLGTCVLMDAVWAAVGEDPLTDVLGVLLPVLDAAVLGVDSQIAADALVGAFPRSTAVSSPVTTKCWGASSTTAATRWRTSPPPGPCRPATSSRRG